MEFFPSRIAAKMLGVHPNTLRKWADSGKIRFIKSESGQRRYDVRGFVGEGGKHETICYCRVSSPKQKDDLQRQIEFMQKKYPEAEIIKDIGSGINFKRKGLRSILERAMRGDKLTVVSAHRDRLCRFGFDLIEWIIRSGGGEVVVLDETQLSPEQELTQDLQAILHVFACRMHGLRKYRSQIAEDPAFPGAEEALQDLDGCEPLCLQQDL